MDKVRAKVESLGWEMVGYIVKRNDIEQAIVLARRDAPAKDQMEWTTWAANVDTGDVYWGHYTADSKDAYADFAKRADL